VYCRKEYAQYHEGRPFITSSMACAYCGRTELRLGKLGRQTPIPPPRPIDPADAPFSTRRRDSLEPMPKLRAPPEQRIPPPTELVSPKAPHRFEKGHKRLGGRQPGTGNFFSLGIRESILTALSNCGGERGLVGFIEAAVAENTGYGIRLLCALAPRTADVTIRNTPSVTSIAELDEELQRAGLPPTSEIFRLDFKGTPIEEAEIVESGPAPSAK
jgi:hypothetical protein